MPPRKEKDAKDGAKAERITGSEAADLVLKYLNEQNRPYSANDISANLHNKVTKAAATKLLKDLADKNLLICRASGKQLVYHVPQTAADAAASSPEHLAALDAQITTLKTNTAAALAETKALRSTIATLGATVPLAELRASVQALEDEASDAESRVAALKAGNAVPVSAEEREMLEQMMRKWARAEKARKKIVKELWDTIVDHVGDKDVLAELRERLGLDE
ncbi:Tat binding protein 1-interacting protein-domain-containing protein [Phyllosticta citricarpa]|uniref:Tat binding protein 1-interacting protein-domain-containing protein n=2 Tax=Phyllosticta TaxID=121621 RepID=A0ABR1MDL0_9PEZI